MKTMLFLLLLLLGCSASFARTDPRTHELRRAIDDQDTQRVAELLDEGAPLGDTGLLLVHGFGNLAILGELIDHGLDPKKIDSVYHRLWAHADTLEEFRGLFKKGVPFPVLDILASGSFKLDAEKLAILRENGVSIPGPDFPWEDEQSYEMFVQRIVATGELLTFAELGLWEPATMRLDDGSTLLHEVVRARKVNYGEVEFPDWVREQVGILIKRYGLDPNSTDERGDTPLHRIYESLARERWQYDQFSAILFDEDGLRATAQRLRELGGSMDVKNAKGLTPQDILEASEGDPVALLALVDSRFTSAEDRADARRKLLRGATQRRDLKVMRHLLEAGVDPNHPSYGFQTPFQHVFYGEEQDDSEELLDLLMAHGARIRNALPDEEYQRFFWAGAKTAGVVRRMVEAGGEILPDPRLFTDWSSERARTEGFYREMVKHGLPVPTRETRFNPEEFASYDDWVRQVVETSPGALRFLVRDGYLTKDYRSEDGKTLLHLLASGLPDPLHESYEYRWFGAPPTGIPTGFLQSVTIASMVETLVKEGGIDPDARDKAGNTALHLVARVPLQLAHQNNEMVLDKGDQQRLIDALIEQGASKGIANARGITPTQLLAADEPKNRIAIAEVAGDWPALPTDR